MTDKWRHPARLVILGAGLVAVGLAIWTLRNLLLLLFGALLVALILESFAGAIEKRSGLSYRTGLVASVLAMFLLVAAFAVLLGAQVAAEIGQLIGRVPDLLSSIERQLDVQKLEEWILEQLRGLLGEGSLLSDLTGVTTVVASALVNILVVIAGGIYIAARPQVYQQGLLKLIPREGREEAAETIAATADALRLWLVGQLLSMLSIGVLTTAGLVALGVPSAFALGFLAGLLEFVPYVGPVLSTIPAVAVALADGPVTAAWVLGLYIAIQQLEAALIMPLIQHRAVDLPPALTIFAVLGFGILLGPWGVVFGAPLTVVSFVLVKKLWVRETLGEHTPLPGSGGSET